MSRVERVAVPVRTRAEAETTNAYVVDADPAVLVDPAAATDDLEALVSERDVGHVVVTHTHQDHVGAVERFGSRATVWARAGRRDRFEAATGVEPDRFLRDGDVVPPGAAEGLRAVPTPGHAVDHLAFEVDEVVIAGDLVVEGGSVVVGAPEGDMRAYLTALRRLHARDPDRLYPGHGGRIDEPRAELRRLLAHRLDRERRVLEAVRSGANTPDAVVEAAYDEDLTGVRDLARATVVAHLEKLATERWVRWDGARAEPTE